MADINYNDEALNVNWTPSFRALALKAREMYRAILQDIERDPTPVDLENKADNIIENLQIVSGVREVYQDALDVAQRICVSVERLGKGKEFYAKLYGLMAVIAEQDNPIAEARTWQCFIHHHLYAGDPGRADVAIQSLLDLSQENSKIPITEALIFLVSVSIVRNGDYDRTGETLARMILDLAEMGKNKRLLGRVYSVLAFLYISRQDLVRTWECAVKVYSAGALLNSASMIANGLHYMGMARKYGDRPETALVYLEMAIVQNKQAKDNVRLAMNYLALGGCHLIMNEFEQAANMLEKCLDDLKNRGYYYGEALYTLGVAETQIRRIKPAREHLEEALRQFEKLQMPFYSLCAKHALAENYWMAGHYSEAVKLGEETLQEVQVLEDGRRDWLLRELSKDVEKYRNDLRCLQ